MFCIFLAYFLSSYTIELVLALYMNNVHFVLFLLIQCVCMLCMNVCKKKRAEKNGWFLFCGWEKDCNKVQKKGVFWSI